GRDGAPKATDWWRKRGFAVRVLELPAELGDGGDVRDFLLGKPARDGAAAIEPLGGIADLDALAEKAPISRPHSQGLELLSLREILAAPEDPIRWLVADLLPQGGLSVLAGKPKAGKSTLARALALSVAQGKPFLGRSVAQGGVVYLALEEKRGEVKRHFETMGAKSDDPISLLIGRAPQDVVAPLAHTARAVLPNPILTD